MAKNIKDFLLEQGVRHDTATEMELIVMALHYRITKLKSQGVDRALLITDLGKWRHLENKNPQHLMEMLRLCLDVAAYTIRYTDRCRLLEHYDIILFNVYTGDYEMTEFGKSFFEQKA